MLRREVYLDFGLVFMIKNLKGILSMKVITNLLLFHIGVVDNLIIRLTAAMEMRIVLKFMHMEDTHQSGKIYVVVEENHMFVKEFVINKNI